jgi:hypothetical protein
MTDDERETMRAATSEARDAFMRRIGEKYPWLHPDYDPRSLLWRERAKRAWNSQGRRPTLY